jgi:hypothetical protein
MLCIRSDNSLLELLQRDLDFFSFFNTSRGCNSPKSKYQIFVKLEKKGLLQVSQITKLKNK